MSSSSSSEAVDSLNVRSALMSLLRGVGVMSSSPNLVREVSTVIQTIAGDTGISFRDRKSVV